jgi:hypothetical protein
MSAADPALTKSLRDCFNMTPLSAKGKVKSLTGK